MGPGLGIGGLGWAAILADMTGYSGTPLARKLGIEEGMRIGVIGAPDTFAGLLDLPAGASLHQDPVDSSIFIVFGRWAIDMEHGFRVAMAHIPPDGAIWVAWPKRSSGLETDMTEDTMRAMFLGTGLVDNKVCAIDEEWSGLRFVVRRENRPSWGAPRQPPRI